MKHGEPDATQPTPDLRPETVLATAGRRPEWTHGLVSPPVYRASTMLFDSVADLAHAVRTPGERLYYGRRGGPTQWALADALTALEPGAAGTTLHPSGLAAITTALMAVLSPGDELLMTDSTYEPTRTFCDTVLARLGIATRYYDPLVGGGIADLFTPATRAVFMESPGSLTFEVQDVPAICAAARAFAGAGTRPGARIVTLLDNTWATPLLFPAIGHGVDLSILACTKYVVGHSDAMLGSVTAAPALFDRLQRTTRLFGQCVSPDDAFLGARGLRTMGVRLAAHGANALAVAQWLAGQPQVARVLHPALPGDPGHALWARDFAGSSGLFAFELAGVGAAARDAFIDRLALFGIGFSWGGFESLALPIDPAPMRTARAWNAPGPLVRLHIGLESPNDLIDDLARSLAQL